MNAHQDEARTGASVSTWPVLLLAAPAGVAIWSGWVGLGELAGFGVVRPLPGIWDDLRLNTAITLPIGMECYAAYALKVWLTGAMPDTARTFARRSAIGALVLGALGQVAYHLMAAAGVTAAPWPVTALVACLPVGVLGMGAALAHLVRAERRDRDAVAVAAADEQQAVEDAARAEAELAQRQERHEHTRQERELVASLASVLAIGARHTGRTTPARQVPTPARRQATGTAPALTELVDRARPLMPLGRGSLARKLGCTEDKARKIIAALDQERQRPVALLREA